MATARFEPCAALRGTVAPPPDKSVSHRAAILAAMGDGGTRIFNYLDAADTHSTLNAVRRLGAGIEIAAIEGAGIEIDVAGVGMRGAEEAAIDVGNAGTLLRILPGWLAGQRVGHWTLDGDQSIRGRPVDRIAEPLKLMGALVESAGGLPPLQVRGAPLQGIDYEMPVASAQVKSCLLLAGLLAEGDTSLTEPAASRDHTERMLAHAGAEIEREADTLRVRPADRLELGEVRVPGDISSAAFMITAACLVPGSDLRVVGVGLNPTRTGLLAILERMGAEIEAEEEGVSGGEPYGRIRVRGAALRGTAVRPEEVPLAIDELPLVALAGCFAEGETVIAGAAELRHKESDRIATVAEALAAVGAEVEATADGIRIGGGAGLAGGRISSHGDHRIAMLGAVAGLASGGGVEVEGMEAAAVSYPRFESDLRSLARSGA